jgi:hypothetical protein
MCIDTLQTICGQSPRSLDPGVSEAVGKVLALNCLQVLNFNYIDLEMALLLNIWDLAFETIPLSKFWG